MKLTRNERKALARAATVKAARPVLIGAAKGRASTGPCRATIDVVPRDKMRGFKIEAQFPSPCDASDRAAFMSLMTVRASQYSNPLDDALAQRAHRVAHFTR